MNPNPKNPVHGILLVNKPYGISSNKVLQWVKRLYGAKKAGHTGCLDPRATGMLPICFGEATKFSQYLLDADKCYQTIARLGVKTSTGDSEGEAIFSGDVSKITQSKIKEALDKFLGKIEQVAPKYSALKFKGRPLYDYARKGIDAPLKKREVEIKKIVLEKIYPRVDEKQPFLDVSITVLSSKGTYIRTLVEDIGDYLETGAHVFQLHRLFTQGFSEQLMFSMDEIESWSQEDRLKNLLPTDVGVNSFPRIDLDLQNILAIQQGKTVENLELTDAPVLRLYSENQQFIGLVMQVSTGVIKAKRLVSID